MKPIVRHCRSASLVAASALAVACLSAGQLRAQATGEWQALFNGRDLTGWTVAAGRTGVAPRWKVVDGVLVGGEGDGRGSLVSEATFKDFELSLEFMLAEHGTRCSAELVGADQVNASADKACLFNSGVTFRNGYQVNIGRREAGEYIGLLVRRAAPGAIRQNVLWLDPGDRDFAGLRRTGDWNTLVIGAQGTRMQVALNGTEICDVVDDPTAPSEARLREAGPLSLQWPYSGEAGGFSGFVKYRNIRIRRL